MLVPNPQSETFSHQAEGAKEASSTFFEKFVFTAVLVVAYAAAAVALVYPVIMYVFW
jgi:hypothetical protein